MPRKKKKKSRSRRVKYGAEPSHAARAVVAAGRSSPDLQRRENRDDGEAGRDDDAEQRTGQPRLRYAR